MLLGGDRGFGLCSVGGLLYYYTLGFGNGYGDDGVVLPVLVEEGLRCWFSGPWVGCWE